MSTKLLGTMVTGSLVTVTLLAGCGTQATAVSSTQANQVIKWADSAEPTTLDMAASPATATENIALYIYENLFALNSHYVPEPMLASSYTVNSTFTNYTFYLRHNVPFQNGQIMHASDVVASIKHWGEVSSIGRGVYSDFSSITARGPYTVNITLKNPMSSLVLALAVPDSGAIIMPASIANASGALPATQFIGTGPYKLVKWVHGQFIELKRFNGYKGVNTTPSGLAGAKHAYIKEILAYFMPSASTAYDGLKTGEYQVADELPSLYYSQVSSDPSLAIHIVKPYAWAGLILNSQVGIFTNPLLRKAASYAINDQNVMAAAFGLPEFYSLSGSLFFKQDKNTYSTVGTSGYNQYNPTKAKQLLTEAHYNGQPITFLETKTYMWMYNADQVVAKDMEAVGFNIKPQLNTWQEQLAIRPHLNEWNMFETSYSAESVSPLSELIFQPGYAAKWNSTRLRNYVNQYESTSNRQTKLAIIGEIQKLFYQEMPDVMEGVDYSMTVTSSNLKGLGSYYLPVLWNAKIR